MSIKEGDGGSKDEQTNHIASPKIENLLNPIDGSISSGSSTTTTTATPTPTTSRGKPPVKKRTRRKFQDIERYYVCDFPNCGKSYGALTHLNEHRVIQKHGPRLKLEDFTNVKKLIEFKKLQQRILNHETIILAPPENNEYYQSILLQEQLLRQEQQAYHHQQQQQGFHHLHNQQQPIYFQPPLVPYQDPIHVHIPTPIYQDPRQQPLNIPATHLASISTFDDNTNNNSPTSLSFANDNNRFKLPPISDLLSIQNEQDAEENGKVKKK